MTGTLHEGGVVVGLAAPAPPGMCRVGDGAGAGGSRIARVKTVMAAEVLLPGGRDAGLQHLLVFILRGRPRRVFTRELPVAHLGHRGDGLEHRPVVLVDTLLLGRGQVNSFAGRSRSDVSLVGVNRGIPHGTRSSSAAIICATGPRHRDAPFVEGVVGVAANRAEEVVISRLGVRVPGRLGVHMVTEGAVLLHLQLVVSDEPRKRQESDISSRAACTQDSQPSC